MLSFIFPPDFKTNDFLCINHLRFVKKNAAFLCVHKFFEFMNLKNSILIKIYFI